MSETSATAPPQILPTDEAAEASSSGTTMYRFDILTQDNFKEYELLLSEEEGDGEEDHGCEWDEEEMVHAGNVLGSDFGVHSSPRSLNDCEYYLGHGYHTNSMSGCLVPSEGSPGEYLTGPLEDPLDMSPHGLSHNQAMPHILTGAGSGLNFNTYETQYAEATCELPSVTRDVLFATGRDIDFQHHHHHRDYNTDTARSTLPDVTSPHDSLSPPPAMDIDRVIPWNRNQPSTFSLGDDNTIIVPPISSSPMAANQSGVHHLGAPDDGQSNN